jgi:hypothetical protein
MMQLALPIFILPDFVKFTLSYQFPKLLPHGIKGCSQTSSEFLAWFSGFTDAEGSFSIVPNYVKQTTKFQFRIRLHKDDSLVLEYIAKTIGIGTIFIDKNSVVFQVSSNNEIKMLLFLFLKLFLYILLKFMILINFVKLLI